MPNTISVVSSVAPVSLGVMANVPYDAVEHPKSAIEHMFMDEHEGIERIPKMTWFIYKVQALFVIYLHTYPTRTKNLFY